MARKRELGNQASVYQTAMRSTVLLRSNTSASEMTYICVGWGVKLVRMGYDLNYCS